MNEIGSYTPEFVVRARALVPTCKCGSCAQTPALISHAWSNQVRHSALLECETVSREMLFVPDALNLYEEVTKGKEGEPLCIWQNNANQGCINLLLVDGLSIPERLYAIGVLLSMVSSGANESRDESVPLLAAQNLLQLIERGEVQAKFAEQPDIVRYKISYLRAMGKLPLRIDQLGLRASMGLSLKLNEMRVMSDDYLVDFLREMEQTHADASALANYERGWINYLLYRCFHDVFPGAECEGYGRAYLGLCLDYFCMNSLFSLLATTGVELDTDASCAVVSTWCRVGRPHLGREDHAVDPLLVGFSLLNVSL
ncbi:hypothetical protein [Pandoraea pulmonicola]|uniref:Lysine-N-methylase n=1 Tax=Pandoraea pulmonicola TaxID=93221 RepID=A0AAJ4ZB46_PANPU|nr:hypothetical protein [Pandoraea pulmonicola]AJC21201.1 hypothetical protein RO07_13230 [Pandoraea pulmonicola]SUA90120.1 Uncharacterised protein [Pandoraea pulmonicola]